MIIFLLIIIILILLYIVWDINQKYNRILKEFDFVYWRLNKMEIDILFSARESMSTRKAIFVKKKF